ncbi:hypothetical protein XF_2138 [Xylella fastidiosa 9a5c]|uniref:Uncharacterized protein n=1 Tax=Xylella fastidiosa (strain 9a5c) TaxID=160492 RepID=Q9PBK6_XYLFA|nr:hypothetical protein XF_2138 [Xylella fastidiosa 9a5c]
MTLPYCLGKAPKRVFDLYKLSGCDFDALNTCTLQENPCNAISIIPNSYSMFLGRS